MLTGSKAYVAVNRAGGRKSVQIPKLGDDRHGLAGSDSFEAAQKLYRLGKFRKLGKYFHLRVDTLNLVFEMEERFEVFIYRYLVDRGEA